MASIEIDKKSDGSRRYLVRYRTPAGESRKQRFDRKVDAEHFAATTETSKLTGAFADPKLGRTLFADWWTTWTGTRVDLRVSTRARDESYYRNHLEPTLGRLQLGAIDRTTLRKWVAKMSASGLAPATVTKAAQLASKALSAAVDERLIARNPAERLPLPRIEVEEMLFIGPADISKLAGEIDERYRVWALTAAYSGLRLGEMAGLRRGRIDLMNKRIEVAQIATEVRGQIYEGQPKTRAGRRSVPIPGPIADELLTWCADLKSDDLVFPAPLGGHMRGGSFRRRFWIPACVATGLGTSANGHYEGLRIHDLRHSAVTMWIAAGASAKEVATWAGHASVATVFDRYGHLLPGQEERVTDALALMYQAAKPAQDATVHTLPR